MASLCGSGAAASAAQVAAAHRLAAAIEVDEGRFAAAAGDLEFNAVQRTEFAVGRLLTVVKARQEAYDEVAEHWTRDGRHGAQVPQVRLQPERIGTWARDLIDALALRGLSRGNLSSRSVATCRRMLNKHAALLRGQALPAIRSGCSAIPRCTMRC